MKRRKKSLNTFLKKEQFNNNPRMKKNSNSSHAKGMMHSLVTIREFILNYVIQTSKHKLGLRKSKIKQNKL
jgi:hypothetical protein